MTNCNIFLLLGSLPKGEKKIKILRAKKVIIYVYLGLGCLPKSVKFNIFSQTCTPTLKVNIILNVCHKARGKSYLSEGVFINGYTKGVNSGHLTFVKCQVGKSIFVDHMLWKWVLSANMEYSPCSDKWHAWIWTDQSTGTWVVQVSGIVKNCNIRHIVQEKNSMRG